MATMNKDFQAENWWATVSGAGTPDAAVESWADDYTRHRSGVLTYSGTTYGEVDMYNHSGDNMPTNVRIGRRDGHTGLELDAAKINNL
jgi:hypothetical protein